ncbi:energy-coupling factor transporter transmembrane component T family protein [Zafaria sp. Z1313]|uniref:energy-coupling factor transporter transmembrane component T family protein n=1 Tax=Zafaria sp. Z1313 TaxID=3423202 RepID=UPI003D301F68
MARLHPFTTASFAATTAVVVIASGSRWAAAATVLACAVAAVRTGRLRRFAAACAAVLVPLWASQLMIHALVDRSGAAALWEVGPLRITAGGLDTALGLGLRAAVLVAVGTLAALAVDRHDLVAAIDAAGVPAQLGYIVGAAFGLGPQLAGRSRAIGRAQALRGAGGRGPAGWLRAVRLRAVPLVVATVQDAALRSGHLAARGFPASGAVVRYREVADSRRQRLARRIAPAAGAVLAVVLIAGGGALP